MKKSAGFVQIIAIIIIFVVVALYLGKNPLGVWNESIKPLILAGFDLIVKAIEFIINFVTQAWQKSR
jgi:hypothetical protein